MLIGKLPFVSDDPMELVHAHIARVPVPPGKVRDEIPPGVSNIVMKLMSKTAEERYQSAAGLKADLEKCRQQLQKKGAVEEFDIGRQDIPERFQIPEKLYGREEEIKILFDEFAKAAEGETRLIFFPGPPGIGKSSRWWQRS